MVASMDGEENSLNSEAKASLLFVGNTLLLHDRIEFTYRVDLICLNSSIQQQVLD